MHILHIYLHIAHLCPVSLSNIVIISASLIDEFRETKWRKLLQHLLQIFWPGITAGLLTGRAGNCPKPQNGSSSKSSRLTVCQLVCADFIEHLFGSMHHDSTINYMIRWVGPPLYSTRAYCIWLMSPQLTMWLAFKNCKTNMMHIMIEEHRLGVLSHRPKMLLLAIQF